MAGSTAVCRQTWCCGEELKVLYLDLQATGRGQWSTLGVAWASRLAGDISKLSHWPWLQHIGDLKAHLHSDTFFCGQQDHNHSNKATEDVGIVEVLEVIVPLPHGSSIQAYESMGAITIKITTQDIIVGVLFGYYRCRVCMRDTLYRSWHSLLSHRSIGTYLALVKAEH